MIKMKTLEETVDMMLSDDYKERLKAEYFQLTYRIEKLSKMLFDWERGEIELNPNCDNGKYEDLLRWQLSSMTDCERFIRWRAQAEGIDLFEDEVVNILNPRLATVGVGSNPAEVYIPETKFDQLIDKHSDKYSKMDSLIQELHKQLRNCKIEQPKIKNCEFSLDKSELEEITDVLSGWFTRDEFDEIFNKLIDKMNNLEKIAHEHMNKE